MSDVDLHQHQPDLAPGDEEHAEVATEAVEMIAAALAGYHLEGAALIHAVRMWRAACHGIATLQTAGGFGLPESVDDTFGYLVDALDAEFCRMGAIGWRGEQQEQGTAPGPGQPGDGRPSDGRPGR